MEEVIDQTIEPYKYLLFFIAGSKESEQAITILESQQVKFVSIAVDPDSLDIMDFADLPTLMGGCGNWSGLTAIKRFIANECSASYA